MSVYRPERQEPGQPDSAGSRSALGTLPGWHLDVPPPLGVFDLDVGHTLHEQVELAVVEVAADGPDASGDRAPRACEESRPRRLDAPFIRGVLMRAELSFHRRPRRKRLAGRLLEARVRDDRASDCVATAEPTRVDIRCGLASPCAA